MLGIQKGDILLVRADLKAVRNIQGVIGKNFIDAILKVIGPSGTLVGMSFSKMFPLNQMNETYIFSRKKATISGAFAKQLLHYPKALRSTHPTNSFVAIGEKAAEILEGHNEGAESYLPMEKIITMNGKMIVVGCAGSAPGFTTVHWAQHKLGLSKKSRQKGKYGVYFEDNGSKKLFVRQEFGGCSNGFDKFYRHYVSNGQLNSGRIGDAYTILILAKEAYKTEYNLLKVNPRFALCENPDCSSCRFYWNYNKRDILHFLLRRVGRKYSKNWFKNFSDM